MRTKIAWMAAAAASLGLLGSVHAANLGTDGAESGYSSGWVTGSGPTDPGAPFGTWTITNTNAVQTKIAGVSGNNWFQVIGDTSNSGSSSSASRAFNGGDLAPGQTFSYDFAYAWEGHVSTLSLMDGSTAVVSIALTVNSTGLEDGVLTVTTPGGVNDTIYSDPTPGIPGNVKDFHISITLGSGANAGQARVLATGGVSSTGAGGTPGGTVTSPITPFDSGWFTVTGSPDTLTLNSVMENANSAFDKYYDNFTVSGSATPEPASLALLGLGGLAMLRRKQQQA